MTSKMKTVFDKYLYVAGLSASLFIFSCAELEEETPYSAQSEKEVEPITSSQGNPLFTGSTIETDGSATVATEIDSDASQAPPEGKETGECIAPERAEFMGRYGVSFDDDDLTDPNVLEAKKHTILFIFDKSGSMGNSWNTDGGSKWDIARDAMISSVSPFQAYLSAGALFFPIENDSDSVPLIDSGKQINYSPGARFLDIWDENMGMYGAGGGTPLMDALEVADSAITHACGIGVLDRPFKVVLLTDGMPNYWDSKRGLELVKKWYDMGISTTVIGMPGSGDATQLLSDIADVGSGGTIDVEGVVETAGTAEEIIYTNESTTDEFEGDMLIACE